MPLDADAACFGPYTEVPDDRALRASAGQGANSGSANYDPALPSDYRCDDAAHGGTFGAGAASWYRLPPGRGLATAPPGTKHCGTGFPGWLSGWRGAAGSTPGDIHYAVAADGALPPAIGLPPADGAVCFDSHPYDRDTCNYPAAVRAVGCGAYALWDLPPVPHGTGRAYCLAA